MKTVGAFEAKTHLNELLQRAANGETMQITRRGIPVARLTPPEPPERPAARTLVDGIRQLRKGVTLWETARLRKNKPSKGKPGQITIRELIDEGRRY